VLSKSDCSAFQRPSDVGAVSNGRLYGLQRFMLRDFLRDHQYYNLYSATIFTGIKAPGNPIRNLPPTQTIIAKLDALKKKIKVR